MPNPVPQSEWKWFGNAGHFISARWCRFHLCTQIGDYLVSSVGEYVNPKHIRESGLSEDEWAEKHPFGTNIGSGRTFETMVFAIIGVACDCGCNLPEIEPHELDSGCYNSPDDANNGHMAMCRKWAEIPVAVDAN